jgi:hypothetical protein
MIEFGRQVCGDLNAVERVNSWSRMWNKGLVPSEKDTGQKGMNLVCCKCGALNKLCLQSLYLFRQ